MVLSQTQWILIGIILIVAVILIVWYYRYYKKDGYKSNYKYADVDKSALSRQELRDSIYYTSRTGLGYTVI